jgi:hypothetical protein
MSVLRRWLCWRPPASSHRQPRRCAGKIGTFVMAITIWVVKREADSHCEMCCGRSCLTVIVLSSVYIPA